MILFFLWLDRIFQNFNRIEKILKMGERDEKKNKEMETERMRERCREIEGER